MGVTDRDDVRRLQDSFNGAGYLLLQADPADTIRSMCEELIEGDADYVALKEKYDHNAGVEKYALQKAHEIWKLLKGPPPDVEKAQEQIEELIEELKA